MDSSDDEASLEIKDDKSDKKDDDKKGKKNKKEENEEIISGTVRRVFAFSGNADNAADSVVVVYISGSHTVSVRGRNIRIPAKTLIPVMLTGKVSGQVDLKFNESSLQFEIVGNSESSDSEESTDDENSEK